MTTVHRELTRAAVRSVHLEQLTGELTGFDGYSQALIVYRLRGSVVGKAWLPVVDGRISLDRLRSPLADMGTAIWRQLTAWPFPQPDRPLSACIAVCTHDRPDDLSKCLKSIASLADKGHEVIVVDSCPSNGQSAAVVRRYPSVRYLHEPRAGLGIARNRVLNETNCDIIAFTDDDAEVDAGWLQALLRNFADPMVGVVTGIGMPLELETSAQVWFERTVGFSRGYVRKEMDSSNLHVFAAGLAGAGVNFAMRREVVGETGLFDEALGPGTPARSGDDHEFFYRVMARGYRIVYDPAAVVWHRHRRDWKALRNMMHGYGVGLFAWWTRALLIEREFTFLKLAPLWFLQHHVKNLAKALLRSNAKTPPDIAFAEFVGALAGPASYLKGRFLAWRYRAFEAQPVVEENRAFLAELSNDTTSSAGG